MLAELRLNCTGGRTRRGRRFGQDIVYVAREDGRHTCDCSAAMAWKMGVGVVDLAGEAESDLGFVQLGKSSSG